LGGNVAREALRLLIDKYSGNSPVLRESVNRKIDEMRVELSGEKPSPLEKLLVERIIATWLHLHHLEASYGSRNDMTVSLGVFYQKSISAAQKRNMAAIKGLAVVRKLTLPALQINVARKQVNVSASSLSM
jgi:hypothetical protein